MIPASPRPLVVAHRGGSYADIAGEQTTAHFERAVSVGADFIEVDLRETADRRIVCVHDADHHGLPVAEATWSALVEASRAAGAPAPALLAELMEVARGRLRLDLEIKAAGFEDRLLAQVRAGLGPGDAIYKSFDDGVVRRLKDLAPGCVAGLLLGVGSPRLGPLTRATELFPEWRAKRCRADFVSPHYRLLRFGFVPRMRRLGLPVLVWTVNAPDHIEHLLSTVDGIVTDRPELALRLRAARAATSMTDPINVSRPDPA